MEQRSPEWFAARLGKVTASRVADVIARTRNGWGASRANYAAQLVCERLTGNPTEGYTNAAMQWGIDHEAEALAAYVALTGNLASSVGFLAHHELMAGGSPDGVIGDFDGLLELKCPKSATHWNYLRNETSAPREHFAQVLHMLWLTGVQYVDFLSFDPRFPPKLRTYYARVTRDERAIEKYDADARAFLAEVDREVEAAQGFDVLKEQISA